MRARRRRAFTLMEVMLVMAILVLLAAISYPTLESLYSGVQRDAGVDAVRAAWAEAQGRSVNEGRAYRFSIVPGRGNFRLAPDGAEFWSGDGAPADEDAEGPPYNLDSALPKGVYFGTGATDDGEGGSASLPAGGVDSAQWVTVAVFRPDGTARNDAEVTVVAPGAKPIGLRLRGLTGVVTTVR